MSSQVGLQAEAWVMQQLITKDYIFVARNVRTRWSEIDLIMMKPGTGLLFIEVKYRSGSGHGSGYSYITPLKLTRMRRAAECYVQNTSYKGDYYLGVVSASRLGSKMYLVE